MQLLAPDILAEARGLSVSVTGPAFTLGLLIWIFGWRGHRFWIVLATTVGAGIFGLCYGTELGTRPIPLGILFAITAGAMALAVVRLVLFSAGGIAAWLFIRAVFPAWEEPLLCFLIGGLVSILLFRIWTMALTSAIGTILMAYSGLCLAAGWSNLDAVVLAEKQSTLLTGGCILVMLLGFLIQFVMERRRRHDPSPPARGRELISRDHGRSWWDGIQFYRRAG